MIWLVDDDGSSMFRIKAPLAVHGPQQQEQQRVAMRVVQQIMQDMENNNIDTETLGTFTRIRRLESGTISETVWKGQLLRVGQVAEAREYFTRLAKSYAGY